MSAVQATNEVKRDFGGSSFDAMRHLVEDVATGIIFGTVTADPGNVTAGGQLNVDVTVAGVLATDFVIVQPPMTLEAGIVVQGATAQAANTIRIRLYNPSGGAVNPASGTWEYCIIRTKRPSVV